MEIRGAAIVEVMVGFLVTVRVSVGVMVCISEGEGVLVTGTSTTRVTSAVAMRVTCLVTSTVCRIGIGEAAAIDGAQETQINRNTHAARQGIKYFK